MIIPNTTMTLLRTAYPAPEDDYGYPVDTDTEVWTERPAWLDAITVSTQDPASGAYVRVDRFVVLFRPPGPDIAESDRLRDDRTGQVYQVETVQVTRGLFNSNVKAVCTQVR